MSHRPQLEAAVEAILFVTTEPVTLDRLLEAFEEPEREEARAALERIRERYAADESRGVRLEEVAGGFRIVTAAECHPFLRRFFDASGANRLSMAALESLAIVAYRQPVTGPEIHELRGKNSSAALRTLLERRLIRISGRKEVVGRPFIYVTTREFLMHFGLRDLKDLPPLEEFEEAFGAEASERSEPAFSQEHESIGLVSTREAEASLGSAEFGIHEHRDHEEGEAAFADRGAAEHDLSSSEGEGDDDTAGTPALAESSEVIRRDSRARGRHGVRADEDAEGGSPSSEEDVVGASARDRDSGSGGERGGGGGVS